MACPLKIGPEAQKSKKAGCGLLLFWGSKSAKNQKKTAFSVKAKCLLSFKKKIGSLAPEVNFLAQVECRADFRVWPKMGLGGVSGRFWAKSHSEAPNRPQKGPT